MNNLWLVDRRRHQRCTPQSSGNCAMRAFEGSWSAALGDSHSLKISPPSASAETKPRSGIGGRYSDYAGELRRGTLRATAFDSLSRAGRVAAGAGFNANAIRTAVRYDNRPVALALSELAIEDLHDGSEPLLLADVLLQRARIAPSEADARSALNAARSATVRIADPSLRKRTEVDLAVVEARLRSSNPASRSAADRLNGIYRHEELPVACRCLPRTRTKQSGGT